MGLAEELERVAHTVPARVATGETMLGVVPVEPGEGSRLYLCAFADADGEASWLVLDAEGEPIVDRQLVRDAASIAALCEIAEETAAGGDLDELRSRLVALRLTENPPGIDEAEEAVLSLQGVIGSPPRVATPGYLDRIGAATLRLEAALGESGRSPFTEAMKRASDSVQAFVADVEARYRAPLT